MEVHKPLQIENELKQKYLSKFKDGIAQQQQVKALEVCSRIILETK
jgi:hypothetical protein